MLGYRIEVQLSPGVWTDITQDLVPDDGLSAGRGIRGNRPTDCVASSGELSFTLDNTAQNSGGAPGFYSVGHPDVRAGWTFGIPVRLVFELAGDESVRWTGKITDILPEPGLARGLRARVTAKDVMNELAENDVRSVPPQIGVTEVEALDATLDSLPVEAQPVARAFDAAVATFPYALDNIGSGVRALGVVQDLMVSAQGFLYPLGDGTLRYENRTSRQVRVTRFAFDDDSIDGLQVPSGLEAVYNRVRLVAHPKAVDAAAVVLWHHEGVVTVAPGETQELWGTYRNPDNDQQTIGGFDFVTPVVAGVDYVGNAAADGSGANLTSSLTVTASPFATSVKVVIQNTGGSVVYLPAGTLQLRGKGVYDRSPVTREAYTPQSYGNRPITIGLPYRDDDAQVQADADWLEANYRSLPHQLQLLEFVAIPGDSELEQTACALDVGDVITISETVTGIDAVSVFINAIDWTLEPSGMLRVSLLLAPRIVQDEFFADVVEVSDALTYDAAAPESRVGFATVGFSEVA
jgi:hypothetical protein